MNKIGIFGDSFAVPGKTIIQWDKKIYINNSKAWMTLIGAKSYGHGGTDVAWSFSQFEKHHSKYDQVIFVLTSPGNRITVDLPDYLLNSTSIGYNESAINELKKNKIISPERRHIHFTLIEWHKMQALDSLAQRETLFCNLLVEQVKALRPDVKFIQAFTWNNIKHINDNKYVPPTNSLAHISYFEDELFGWQPYDDGWYCSGKLEDGRVGHLTAESHTILAELVNKWLQTDEMFFDFDIKEFHSIEPDEKMYNMALHNSLEDWVVYCKEHNLDVWYE